MLIHCLVAMVCAQNLGDECHMLIQVQMQRQYANGNYWFDLAAIAEAAGGEVLSLASVFA